MSEAADPNQQASEASSAAQGSENQPSMGTGAGGAAAAEGSSAAAEATNTAEPSAAGGASSSQATEGASGATAADSTAASTPTDAQSGHTSASNAAANEAVAVASGHSPESGHSPDSAVSKATSVRSNRSNIGKSATTSSTKPMSAAGARSKTSPGGTTSAGNTNQRPASSNRRKRMKLGELDLSTAKIGFIGAGKMAESTINGLIHYAKINPQNIHVSAPSSKGLEKFKTLGCRVTKRNYDIFGRYDCDIIFLCFHGYVIKHCYKMGGVRPHPLTTNYIPHQRHPIYILSLVSGVSLSQIKACLLNPESTNRYVLEIHRIMMNTAVGHGLGICAIDCEPDSKKLSAPLRQLLSSIAQLENVPASQMDAACAVGGSGLAFSYYFINALADGAFKMGLSRAQAIRFASKTAQCAAQTMLESGKHPAELRDNVSSPSGAAIYGIHVLEKNDVVSGVTAAVEAAHKRAHDLATQDTSQ